MTSSDAHVIAQDMGKHSASYAGKKKKEWKILSLPLQPLVPPCFWTVEEDALVKMSLSEYSVFSKHSSPLQTEEALLADRLFRAVHLHNTE